MTKTSPPEQPAKVERKIRIGDVAARAGVSVGTVSNVLNGRGKVSDLRRERVERAIVEMSYSGSLLAKGMRGQRFPVVGFCVPNATSTNFVGLSDRLESLVTAAGYELVQVISRHAPERERARIERLIATRVSGVVLLPTSQADALIARLNEAEMPTVAINRFVGGALAVDNVVVDQRRAFRTAAARLIEADHTAFVFLSQFPQFAAVQHNIAGIRDAILDGARDVPLDIVKCGLEKEGFAGLLAAAFAERPGHRIAVIASSSLLAAWSIQALRDMRVSIPECATLFCSEDPEWAHAVWPPLSCIRQPTQTLARHVWARLQGRMNGNDEPPVTILCEAEVEFRGLGSGL